MYRRTALLAFLLVGVAASAAAQTPQPPQTSTFVPASRMRVKTMSMSIPSRGITAKGEGVTVTGVVIGVESGVLTMVPADGEAVKIPLASVLSADVSVGKKNNWKWGLVSGAVLGFGLGFAPTVDASNCGSSSTNYCSRGTAIAAMTATTTGLGALFGTIFKTDRWERRFTSSEPRR